MILLKPPLLLCTAFLFLSTGPRVLAQEEVCKIVVTYDIELIIGIGSSDSSQVCSQSEQQSISGVMERAIRTALEATGRLKDETGFGYGLTGVSFSMCAEAWNIRRRLRVRSLASSLEKDENMLGHRNGDGDQRQLLGGQFIYRGSMTCGFSCAPDNGDARRRLNACPTRVVESAPASLQGWTVDTFHQANMHHLPILGNFIGPFGSISRVSKKFQIHNAGETLPSNSYIVIEFGFIAKPSYAFLSSPFENKMVLQVGSFFGAHFNVELQKMHEVGVFSGPDIETTFSWARRTYNLKRDSFFTNPPQLHIVQLVVQYDSGLMDSQGQLELQFEQMKFDGISAYLGDITVRTEQACGVSPSIPKASVENVPPPGGFTPAMAEQFEETFVRLVETEGEKLLKQSFYDEQGHCMYQKPVSVQVNLVLQETTETPAEPQCEHFVGFQF